MPVPNDHRVWGGAASGREPKKSLAFARPWASVFEDSYVVVDNSIFTNNKPQTTMERHLEEANKLNNHIHIHTNTQYTALNIASYVHIPRYSLSRPLDTQPSLGRTHFSLFGHTSSLRSRRSCFDLPGTLEQFSMERIPSTSDQHDRTPRVQLPMQCSIEHIS